MEDNSKYFVFAKKEVALVFLFMILIAVTSFIFGVKVGKQFSFEASGLTEEDRAKVELLSREEESVNDLVERQEEEKAPEAKAKTTSATKKKSASKKPKKKAKKRK